MNQVYSNLFKRAQLENNYNSQNTKAMESWPRFGIICFIYHVKSFLRIDYHFFDCSIKRRELGGAKNIFRLIVEYYSKKCFEP